MQKALRDGAPLVYFGDVWLSVLNDTVDSQADFQASKIQSNMDFTTKPGYAELAKQADAITQTAKNDEAYIYELLGGIHDYRVQQSFVLAGGRWIIDFKIWLHQVAGSTRSVTVEILSDMKEVVFSTSIVVLSGTDMEVTITPTDLYLDAGEYWINIGPATPNSDLYARIQNTDVYADGALVHVNGSKTGDIYFSIAMQKYSPSGSFRTRRLDLGEAPRESGTFQMAYSHPVGTLLQVDLYGYTNETDTSPAVTLLDVDDGQSVPAYQYWEVAVSMASNAALDQTPQIDMLEFLYPKDSLKLREKDKALRNVSDEILGTYQALLTGVEYRSSDIKIIERVASGGEISMVLEDPTGETVQRVISDSPLKNFRAILYLGADVPGFKESDLLRFFTGTVQAGKYKPRYRRESYQLSLTCKNPILELKRKVPQPAETGAVTLADISINYDGTHVMDAMLDLLRGEADIPARYIDLEAFNLLRSSIGDASLPAAAHVVRRSNAAGLPDNRIKNPEEVGKLLGQVAMIADVYVTIDEDSRITAVKHDPAAAAEADWADEALVRAGLDAVPIEDVGDIDLGYDQFLFNTAMFGCEWTGSGGDWTEFGKVYANVDSTSADEFAPGKAVYLSIMEKNLKEASQWLGPEAGYNGETIAQALSARYVARHAFPPVVMTGVVVPQSEFVRTLGSVVRVWSPEFAKFRRRGIALSESIKFMITSKKLDRAKNRMVFSLLELT
jgi:hypothetical protein